MIDTAVVLAIGSASHHSNLTQNRPKAMLPALGKPMVVRVMERLYQAGIRYYYVIVGINEGAIASYLSKQWKPDAKVDFILRSNESILTLVGKAAGQINNAFIIASYNSFSYERFFTSLIKRNESYPDHLILAGAQLNLTSETRHAYAILDQQKVKDIVFEKPDKDIRQLILGEIAICGGAFLDYLNSQADDKQAKYSRDLFQLVKNYLATEDAKAMADETSWMLRIQSDSDLLMLNKRLLEDSNDSHILSELPYTAKVIPPVRIDPQVSAGQGVVIGPNVYIESGTTIGYGAKISNALILEGANIPANAEIDNSIVTRRDTIKL